MRQFNEQLSKTKITLLYVVLNITKFQKVSRRKALYVYDSIANSGH